MTPEQHNHTNGILHIVYAVLQTLLFGFFVLMFGAVLAAVPPEEGGEVLGIVGGFLAVFFLLFWLIFAVPSFIAGYAMLKRKPWARVAGIIAAVLASMNVPHGTGLCIYSLWFLLSEKGINFYKQTPTPHGYNMNGYGATQEGYNAGNYNTGNYNTGNYNTGGEYLPNDPSAAERMWNTKPKPEEAYMPPPQSPDWRG